MIKGIGIDLVQIKRMERWVADNALLKRFFHPDEIAYSLSMGKNAAAALAARFAAKEAYGKALGTGLANLNLNEIMVLNNENGKPKIKLFGSAQSAMEKSGADIIHISLTHEKDNAAAVIILEKV
ncbi:MAG: holo-ACP synthase [Treponema sp.]|nr:holo-ACP synthase [Treponema sp.]MCL2272166.1 holo-ACP synthase [Treponema sp.]